MSLSEQLSESFKNNEEDNQEVNLQVNQQINQQVNQDINQQEVSNNIQLSNNRLSPLLCCTKFFFFLESMFFFIILILLFSFNYLKLGFGFGIPCSLLPCIIVVISESHLKPKITFITNFILVLIKTGLFVGFFIAIRNLRLLLIGIFPEVAFDFILLKNDRSKLNNRNNRNQDNN